MPGKCMTENRVTFEIPPYNATDPVLWFYLIEILFRKIGGLSSKAKYEMTLLSLGSDKSFGMLHEMRDLIFGELVESPEPYETLKANIIKNSVAPEIAELTKEMKNGKLKPTEYLKRIKEKFGYPWNSNVELKQIFTQYLPSSLRELVKIIERESSLETIAASLDGVFKSVLLPSVTITSNPEPLENIKKFAERDAKTNRTRTRKKRKITHHNQNVLPNHISPVVKLEDGKVCMLNLKQKVVNCANYPELKKPSFIGHFRIS